MSVTWGGAKYDRPRSTGAPAITMEIDVRFPRSDLEEVLKRLQSWNARKRS